MMTKQELTGLIKLGRVHEVFTHTTEGTFDVTLMRGLAKFGIYEKFQTDLTLEIVAGIKASRDWDQERIDAITIEEMNDPTLWMLLPDETHLLLDGTHRILARAKAGASRFFGYMARYDQIIRPDYSLMAFKPEHDWGKIEVRDGKLFDRETGEEIR